MSALQSWREEKRAAWLYRRVSDQEAGTTRQVLFLELARAADAQAALWAAEVRKASGHEPPEYRPDMRARLVAWLLPRTGVRAMKGVLAAMKIRGMSLYQSESARGVSEADAAHAERHASGARNTLRAAVFGVNDGLISNASLMLGVAGADASPGVVLLSGLAGLMAGAFSMAAGEYVSVRSQREFHEHQMAVEQDELDQYPEEEAAELSLIYQAKGLDAEAARALANTLIQDPDRALDTLAREELGLNPDDLGAPWTAAFSSFGAFALGASLPVLPFLLLSGELALIGVLLVTGIALFGVGAAISLFTGRHAFAGGLRMLLIGALAGGATWGIGRVLGITLG